MEITAYLNRDNEERFELLQDGIVVPPATVTGAVFRFGSYCIDSEQDPDLIYFLDADNQVVCMKIGLTPGLAVGKYKVGTLTIFDSASLNGIAWAVIGVKVLAWNVCPVTP